MSINLVDLYSQEYSTNVQLLLQQKGSKLRGTVMEGTHSGNTASPVDQIGSVEASKVTTRFEDIPRTDAPTARRWVSPVDYDLNQLVDTLDKLRMISDPESVYVTNALYALGRKMDYEIITAFQAAAKTGIAGASTTNFNSSNNTTVSIGGTNSTLNVAKLRSARKMMMANHIDLDTETPFIGITAVDHDALLGEIQVISSDFNAGAPVLKDGRISSFLGFQFVHCELIETAAAGTNKVNLPVWVKSGMHLGVWNGISTDVSIRKDLRNLPYQVYTMGTFGATRLEENKVYNIESYRA